MKALRAIVIAIGTLAVAVGAAGVVAARPPAGPAAQPPVIATGDIIVADPNAFGGAGGIIRVDPTTGAQTVVSSGGLFVDPMGVTVDRNGDIIVVDQNAFGGAGGLIRVDAATGGQTIISAGGAFANPTGVALDANGDIIVADRGPGTYFGTGYIFRVNPTTGAQTLVSSGGYFLDPNTVAVDTNGDIFVADNNCCGGAYGIGGGIIRVDPATGAQTLISSGGSFLDPFGVAIDANRDVVLADPCGFCLSGGVGVVFKIAPATGAQIITSTGSYFVSPTGVAIDPTGLIVVVDQNAFAGPGGVIGVDPVTGVQTIISSAGFFVDPSGVAIYPVLVPDTIPPTWPVGSMLIAGNIELTRLTLTWTPAQDNVGVTEYPLYQDFRLITTARAGTTSFTASELLACTTYTFSLRACDRAGQCSKDGPATTVSTLTPQQAVQLVIDRVNGLPSFVLKQGQARSLTALLERVIVAMDKGQTAATISLLNTFVAQVQKLLPNSYGQMLIDAVNEVLKHPSC